MAEAVLKDELKKRKIRWYSVSSAGLRAEAGSGLNPKSAAVLSEADIPVPAFESRQLTEKMIAEAYAVVCMTEAQRRELSKYPNVTSMYALSGREIPDPYGQDVLVYRDTLRAIRAAMPDVIGNLGIRNEEAEPAQKAGNAGKAAKAVKAEKAGKTGKNNKTEKAAKTAESVGTGQKAKTQKKPRSGKRPSKS